MSERSGGILYDKKKKDRSKVWAKAKNGTPTSRRLFGGPIQREVSEPVRIDDDDVGNRRDDRSKGVHRLPVPLPYPTWRFSNSASSCLIAL